MSKFTVNRNALLTALNTAGKAINQNAIVPALGNYLFRISPEQAEICGSNNEIFISKKIPCTGEFTGAIQLPSDRMQFIKDLPEQPIIIEVGATSVTIIASTGEYIIPYEPGEDYPVMKIDKAKPFGLPGSDLYEGILKTLFAVHPDQTLPFSGVRIETGATGIKFVGTNISYFSSITFAGKYPEHELLASAKLLATLSGLKLDGNIDTTISKSTIHFDLPDSVTVTAVLMDMKYPAYDQIIPKNNDKSLTINRDELIGSLKRTVQFSNDVIKTVKFTLDTMVTLSSLNPKGEQAKEVLLGTYEDEPLEININGVFALSCLQKLDGETVTMTFSTPKRAVLITEENNVMLVMPYQL